MGSSSGAQKSARGHEMPQGNFDEARYYFRDGDDEV
jgi:hypothetical protein